MPVVVDDPEFSRGAECRERFRQADAEPVEDKGYGDEPSGEIEHELDAVEPYDRADAAREGIDEGDDADNEHRQGDGPSGDGFDDHGRREKPYAVGQNSGDEKNDRREFLHVPAEPLSDHFVNRGDAFTEIQGQQHDADEYSAENVAEGELQKGPVAPERDAGYADEGKNRGFRGHDRKHGHDPGDIPSPEKVIPCRPVGTALPDTVAGHRCQKENDDHQVQSLHALCPSFVICAAGSLTRRDETAASRWRMPPRHVPSRPRSPAMARFF